MRIRTRPHSRRLLLAAAALAALGAAPATASVADGRLGGWKVERVEIDGASRQFTAGPDGRLWALAQRRDDDALLRIAATGVETRRAVRMLSYVAPLALVDGRVGWVGEQPVDRWFVVKAGPDGQPVERALPPAPTFFDQVALAPDGSVWRGRSCGRLQRIDDDGRTRSYKLGWGRCVNGDPFARLAFGGDGSTWYASFCAGRVVRIAVDGRRRDWRVRPLERACGEWVPGDFDVWTSSSPVLLPSDDGGLAFGLARDHHNDEPAGWRIGAGGKLVAGASDLLPVLMPDGSTWGYSDGRYWRRAADGRRRTIEPSSRGGFGQTVVGPDGRLWASRRTVTGSKSTLRIQDVSFEAVGADGAASLDGLVGPWGEAYDYPVLETGSGGTMWIVDGTSGWRERTTLLRLVPDGGEPTPVRAVPRRVVARAGAIVWLQIRCDAAPGSFCTTSATLARRGGDAPLASVATASVPGGTSRTVPLKLTTSARARLRAGRVLRAAAVVRGEEQEPARLAVRLAPGR